MRERSLGGLLVMLAMLVACKGEVLTGLDEPGAQAALAALGRGGVAGLREPAGEGRYAIVVPSGDVARAAAVLEAEGLPRRPQPGFAQLYANPSMIPSPTEERARFTSALSGEIAGQLEHLDQVLHASVLVNVPAEDPLAAADAPREVPSASVLLTLRAGAAAPPLADVQHLVAGAVPGLGEAKVTVVMQNAPAPPAGPPTAFDSVAGIVVARGSKTALIAALAGALALIMAMGAWAAVAGARRRRQIS